MSKSLIKNYHEKMYCLKETQLKKTKLGLTTVCAISGKEINPVRYGDVWYDNFINIENKLDFCHIISRTEKNIEKYPVMIDSLVNGVMALHVCHLSSSYPNYPKDRALTELEAEAIEKFLNWEKYPNEFKSYRLSSRQYYEKTVNCDLNICPDESKLAVKEVLEIVKESLK